MTDLNVDKLTPPPGLVEQWCAHSNEHENYDQFWRHIATQAARWGADQELEACCEWLADDHTPVLGQRLRSARRPKPPSRKEQALEAISRLYASVIHDDLKDDAAIVRRALEALPND
jgi:hypothetical protein